MGQHGIFECSHCGNQFNSSIGGTMSHEQFACIECDHIQSIIRSEDITGMPCTKCGGEMVAGINRKCPGCGQRYTSIVHTTICSD